jgi:muconolactone delta-isomerase
MSSTDRANKPKFMAVVHVSGLSPQEVAETMPHEDQIVRELMDEGVIEALYVRGDLGGAFIVGTAVSADAYRAYLQRLPLFPHMTIEFVPLFDMPEF